MASECCGVSAGTAQPVLPKWEASLVFAGITCIHQSDLQEKCSIFYLFIESNPSSNKLIYSKSKGDVNIEDAVE